MKKPNFYSYQGLDRLDRFRDDPDWFADVLQSNRTRLLPLWRNQHWVTALNQPISFPADEDPGLITQATECVLLGSDQSGTTWIALDISQLAQPEVAALQEETHDFRDLRTVGPLIDRQTGALLAHARAMMHWHRQHRY
ncbi:MAG: hypothetical protein OQL17_13065, partial [Sedimenticola sp.]|nr:hypothetical protein [Sedimenticola sp.]